MFAPICKIDELQEGELYRFDVHDKPLLVVKFEGNFFVTNSICTHEEADLSLGMFGDGIVTCPLHRAKFKIQSGEVVSGPDGTSPESIQKLTVYAIKAENGQLYADI